MTTHRLPPAARRKNMIMVRLTPAERLALEKAAKTAGLYLSTWARKTLLDTAQSRG